MKSLLVVAGILVVALTLVILEFGARLDVNEIESALMRVEGIEILDIWGNEDVTLQDVYVVIYVTGKGTVTVLGVTPKSVTETGHVRIAQIGNWEPDVLCLSESGDIVSSWNDIDLGRDANLAGIIGPELESIQDLVVRYDEVLSSIEKLPEIPQRTSVRLDDGRTLQVGLIRASKSRWQRD
jgi:hypothetical protein